MTSAIDYGLTRENQRLWRTVLNPENEAVVEVMTQLEEFCNVNNTCHIPGDPYSTAYNEGQRSVAIFIRQMLETDLTTFEQPAEDIESHGKREPEQRYESAE